MGARILVVDDSVTIQKVVELTLSKEDFVLVQAKSGDEAIRKALEARPDLVLLDILMPDKDGYAVCAELRAQPSLRGVPVILLTGTFEVFDKDKAAKVGANDFVTKPFESQVLIGKVRQLLQAAPPEAPGAGEASASAELPGLSELSLAAAVGAPPPPPPAGRHSELSAPSIEISQDQLWQLLDAPPPPASGSAPEPALDLTLDTLEPAPAAEAEVLLPEVASLDLETDASAPEPALDLTLDTLEPAPAPDAPAAERPESPAFDLDLSSPPPPPIEAEAPPAAEAETAHLGDLSLDDLLAGVGISPERSPSPPEAGEAPTEASVFDLTASLETPPLPMVEAEGGETPGLSIEELLDSMRADAPPPAESAAPRELPDGDLLSAAFPPDEVTPAPAAPEALPDPEAAFDLGLDTLEPAPPALAEETLPEAADLGLEPAPAAPEPDELPERAEQPPASVPDLTLDAAVVESSMEAPPAAVEPLFPVGEAVEAAAPPADRGTRAAAAGLLPAGDELAGLREAVAERVARELVREVSEKLAERIEKAVWEIVPDLAEVLLTREIERIRRMADEQQSP